MSRGHRPWLVTAVGVLAALVAGSCSEGPSGPAQPVPGYFALAPSFTTSGAALVDIDRIRVVLTRTADSSVAKDTVIGVGTSDSVDLSLTVPILEPGESFLLTLALITPAGDTAFSAGPLVITPATGGEPTPVVDVPFSYVGVGADAADVEIVSLPALPLLSGDTALVTAIALDSAGEPIPGTPVEWFGLDASVLAVPDPDSGLVVGGTVRGNGRVVARLLTGQADTAAVGVTLPPSAITAESGSGQSGPINAALPAPLLARVTASDGVGVPGVLVRLTVPQGGGSVSVDSMVTDSTGRASVTWTLGPNVGAQRVEARAPALSGAVAAFTATGVVSGVGAVSVAAGDGQAALVGTVLPVNPAVLVEDPAGNPVSGVTVTFAVTGGGGAATGDTATTDSAGIATVGSWQLGPQAGTNTLTATVDTLNPVVFNALGTGVNGALTIAITAGDGQSATVGTAVPVAPGVTVLDTANAVVAGVPVAFTVTAGGGAASPDTVLTDAQGVATLGSWTLGPAAGANALTATSTGLSTLTFNATGTVGAPDTVVIISGDAQSDTAGTALPDPLVVEVRDSLGNPVPGATVTWTTLQGSLAPPSSVTDATGQTQSTWTLGTNAVSQAATAGVTGIAPATFSATAIFPNPTILLNLTSGGTRIVSGGSETLDITLTAPAPAGGVNVAVTSDNPAVISVAIPDTAFIPQDSTTGQVTLNAPGGGTTTVRATATGYTDGALSVTASVQVLSMPTTLNVPLGGTASVPLQISAPAPAGGVTVTLSSDTPANVSVATPSVTIPEGSQTANATVNGVAPGPATITGTTANFGNAQTIVTTTANLNITTTNLTINGSFGDTVLVRLESSGIPIAAPNPGVTVTLSPSDPTCINVPGTVTIPTGLVDTAIVVTYGGSATLACTGTVAASAPSVQPDTMNVTVNPIPGINVATATNTGSGLQRFLSGSLGAFNHGGTSMVVRSTNPAALLVAPNATTAGSDSIVISFPINQTSFTLYAQGVPGQVDTVDIVYAAPGFVDDTTQVIVDPPAVDMIFLSASTTSFSPPDAFQIRVGVPNPSNTGMAAELARSAGLPPISGTITLTDSVVAELETSADTAGTVTVEIAATSARSPSGIGTGGVQLTPRTAGSTTVSATLPGFITLPSASTTVTISAPNINAATTLQTGSGLQRFSSASLGASNHPGVDVVIRSADPAIAVVAPDQATTGTDSIVISLPTGSTGFNFYAQGLPGVTDTTQFIITAAGFNPDTMEVQVLQPAVDLIFLSTSTTTFTAPDAFQMRVGLPNAASTAMSAELARSPGLAPVTATIVLSDSTVAELETGTDTAGTVTVEIVAGQARSPSTVASGGVQLAPRAAGTTTVSGTVPGFTSLPTASSTVTISAPGISVTTATTTGGGLQRFASGGLGASNHPGVDVVIRSSDPAVALVAPDAATVGTDSIVIPLASGFTGFSFYAQGVDGQTGTADFVVTALGFTPDTMALTVVQPAVDLIFLSSSTTTLSPNDPFQARIGIPNAGNTGMSAELARNPGAATLTVTATSSPPGVGELVTQSLTGSTVTSTIVAGQARSPSVVGAGGIEFQPLTAGSTTVDVSIPGFIVLPTASQAITVSTPSINLSSTTTAAGLQRFVSGSLGASNHGGTTLIVRSSNFGVLRLSPAADSLGRDSLVLNIPDGTTGFNYYVQGQDGQTGNVSVTATAAGFTDGSSSIDVVAPAVDIIFLGTTQTAGGSDDVFQVRVGVPNVAQTGMVAELGRNGGAAPLVASVTSDNGPVGTLVFAGGPADSGSVDIAAPASRSPSSVASGGVAFRPLTAGSINVMATIPGFVTLPAATVAVTVNP